MILLTAILIVVVVFALLAPLDSMRWWERRGRTQAALGAMPANPDHLPRRPDARLFVVYLSGIGAVDGTTDAVWERETLAQLAAALPDVAFTADVFPYDVENRGLTQRASSWFWGKLASWQRTSRNLFQIALSYLINLRNALRVLVSADPRYGPIFNLSVAQQIIDSLDRHQYDWSRRPPVIVIGYSGGGQIAVGAGWYLTAAGLPISVISLAGVVDSHPGLARLNRLWHFYGSKDDVQRIGPLVFPGRWPIFRTSLWNKGKRSGQISVECIGPMTHVDKNGYFDPAMVHDGKVNRTVTEEVLTRILLEAESAGFPNPSGQQLSAPNGGPETDPE